MIEAVDPIKTDPISMSDACKMFEHLPMQWIWIWMCTYNVTAALIDQEPLLTKLWVEIWVTPGQQMMVKCSDWGCRTNQNWSHINVRHMQGVWQHLYAVDVNMDVSLQHYDRSHWTSFGKSPRNLGNSWATNDGEVVDPLIPGYGQTIPRSASRTRQHHLNVAREPLWLS